MKRRGMVYVVVMGVCGLAVAIALAGVTLSGRRASSSRDSADSMQASVFAQDALMDVLRSATNTSSWRALAASGTLRNSNVGTTQILVTASDPTDGDLVDSLEDPIMLTAEVQHARVRRLMRVTIEPDVRAIPCLGYSIVVGGDLKITGSTVSANAGIHANSTAEITSSTVSSDLSSAGSISGSGISGSITPNAGEVELPAASDVVGAYRAIVPEADRSCGDVSLNGMLVSPSLAALGGVSGDLAVINLGGRRLTLTASRVAGSIVATKAGEVRLQNALLMTPSVGMPALVTRSDAVLTMTRADFSESSISTNLNPAVWPYLGVSDADTSDWYPSEINGVVYVGGDMEISGDLVLNGTLVVEGDLVISGANVTVRWNALTNVPPGFRVQPEFRIVPGSMTRVVGTP